MALTGQQLTETELTGRNGYGGAVQYMPVNEVIRRIPVYTTTQRDALSPEAGWLIWNSTAAALQVWVGAGGWKTVTVS